MILDQARYKRPELEAYQKDFLARLVSFARFIQQQTYEKAILSRISTPAGVLASIVMADIAVTSNWGEHELSKKENNLLLLESGDHWHGKEVEFQNKKFKSYPNWLDFSIDLSDEITFFKRKQYEEVLRTESLESQLIALKNLRTTDHSGRIEEIIERYGLWEFDN